jgi:hypothetical protein
MKLTDLEEFGAYRYQDQQVDYLGPDPSDKLAEVILPDGTIVVVDPEDLAPLD